MKRTPLGQIGFAGFIVALTMSGGCNHQDQQSQQFPRPVKVFRIGEETPGKTTAFAGEVRPRWETTLAFRVAGKISARSIEAGDHVRKGQRLIRLDASDYQLATQALKAQLKSAESDRDFARNDLVRYRELLKQQVISPPEFDRHNTTYNTAQKRVEALQAQLKVAQNQLNYTEMSADRNGIVTALMVEAGQVINAGQPVIKIAQLNEKEIQFDIPEYRISEITENQSIEVSLWSSGEQHFRAQIREVAATAEQVSRTYRIKARLLEGLDNAQLGMSATVWLPDAPSHAIAVPLPAIFTSQHDPKQTRVWVVDGQSKTVKSVPVRIGKMLHGELIEINSGLGVNQWIVTAGVHRLTEGQAVRLMESPSVSKSEAIEAKMDTPL